MASKIKIRGRIILPVLAILFASVVLLLSLAYVSSSRIITDGVKKEGNALAARYANQARAVMERMAGTPRDMANAFIAMKRAGNPDRRVALEILSRTLEANPRLLGSWTVWEPNAFDGADAKYRNAPGHDATGRFVTVFDRGTGTVRESPNIDYEKEGAGNYYLIPKRSMHETVLEPYYYSYTGKKADELFITSIVVPIIIDGTFGGVVGVDIAVSELEEITKDVNPYKGSYAFLASNSGIMLAHPQKAPVGKPIVDDTASYKNVLLDALRSGSTFTQMKKNLITGETSYVSFAPIQIGDDTHPWTLGVVIPLSSLLASRDSFIFLMLLVGLATSIVASLVLVVVARGISLPIKLVAEANVRFSNGDFALEGFDLAGMAKLRERGDEIGDATRALTKMMESISAIAASIQTASAEVSGGASQVSQTAQALSQGTTEQAASGEEVSSAMEEMSANIKQNADNALATESISRKSAVDADEGGKAVAEAVAAMKEIAQRIGIIEEIARQTNLLALNAAIEAARAGEAGKGFAVVASEVRKLAERSQQAAGEITSLARSSTAIAEKAGQLMRAIVPDIQKTADLVQEIASSSREQTQGVEQINLALSQLDQVIQQNASAAEELAAMAEELTGQSNSMQDTVSFFKLGAGHARPQKTARRQAEAAPTPAPRAKDQPVARRATAIVPARPASDADDGDFEAF
jgi:methyl-accepting chemotaxis protein